MIIWNKKSLMKKIVFENIIDQKNFIRIFPKPIFSNPPPAAKSRKSSHWELLYSLILSKSPYRIFPSYGKREQQPAFNKNLFGSAFDFSFILRYIFGPFELQLEKMVQ